MRMQPLRGTRAMLGLIAGCAATVAACGGASDRHPARDARSKTTVTVMRAQPSEPPAALQAMTLAASEPSAGPMGEPAVQAPSGRPHRMAADRIATHPVRNEDITSWKADHEVAASELVDWARTFPHVAAKMYEWDEKQSDRVKMLTDWAATRRYEELEYFVMTHPWWEALRTMMENPRARAGLEAYVEWARRNSDAALELVVHPRGLSWAGQHVIAPESGSPRGAMPPMR